MRTLILASALLALIVSWPVAAQAPEETAGTGARTSDGTRVSFGLGMGAGTYDFAGAVALAIEAPGHSFVLRTAGASEFNIFSRSATVSDLAVLYGRRRTGRSGFTRLAVGPSVVWSEQPGGPDGCSLFSCNDGWESETTVGLAAQADAAWALTDSFGLGASLFGNLNGNTTFAGVSIGVHFGELR